MSAVRDGKLRAAESPWWYVAARFPGTRISSNARVEVGAPINDAVIIPTIRYRIWSTQLYKWSNWLPVPPIRLVSQPRRSSSSYEMKTNQKWVTTNNHTQQLAKNIQTKQIAVQPQDLVNYCIKQKRQRM